VSRPGVTKVVYSPARCLRYVATAYANLPNCAAPLARATLTAMWTVCAVSFAMLAQFSSGAMLMITQVMRRWGEYGLFKPSREMLFTVLSRETKSKSRSLLDTVLQRGSDSVGNGLYLLVAPLGLAAIAGLGATACVLLILGCSLAGGCIREARE